MGMRDNFGNPKGLLGRLMLAGMNLFDALTHTFGTVATGGFSPKNASVGYYNSSIVESVSIIIGVKLF